MYEAQVLVWHMQSLRGGDVNVFGKRKCPDTLGTECLGDGLQKGFQNV